MAIPQLQSCCCGCSLKTGTKIIGWLSLVVTLLMVIGVSMGLAALFYLEEQPPTGTPEDKAMREHLPALKAFAMFFILMYTVSCALSIVLLLGVYQDKAKLVLIWVVVMFASILISFALHLVEFLALPQKTSPFEFVGLLIDLYFILVVYSFYREIRNVSGNYA